MNSTKILILFFLVLLFNIQEAVAQNNSSIGYLKFNLNVDSAHVVINNDYFAIQKIANGDSLKLPTGGQHLVNLSIPFDDPYISNQPVYENATTTLTHSFTIGDITPKAMSGNVAGRYYYDSNVMILTDDDSQIFYENELIGTGFARLNTEDRKGNITIKNPDFGSAKLSMTIRENRVNFIESYRRPSLENVRYFSWFPGASQFLKRQYLKGFAFAAGSALLFTYTGKKFKEHSEELDTFKYYKARYKVSANEPEALRWGDLAEKQKNKVRRIDNQRRALLVSSMLVYGFNFYDAFFSDPSGGYQGEKHSLKFYLQQEEISGAMGTTGTFRYNF